MKLCRVLMSPSADAVRQYPVACPTCDQVKGYPCQVRTLADRSGAIEVRLRCRVCSHEWVEVVSSPD